ncbi:MAG: SMP-30/gluconolactonase/LRE family protein [Pyrinomonadaceae bacterium]
MKVRRPFLFVLAALTGVLVLYLLLWPVSISPQAWTPQTAPSLTGSFQQNSRLSTVERLSIVEGGTGFGPEDIALDSQKRIYAGIDDGRIIRLQADGIRPEVFANTQGRPLGLVFDSSGNLIVADANRGLLSINRDGLVTVLSTESDGVSFGWANDLDVAADGTIYFTDASKLPFSNLTADLLEHQPNGRLLAYDPKTKITRTILNQLYFPNGVAVSPNQSFLLVVETGRYSVRRVWLNKGPAQAVDTQTKTSSGLPRYGTSEIFIDNLPGFPDGITSNGRDKFWLALVNPRNRVLDKVLPYPFLRKVIFRLPRFIQPAPERSSFVIGLDLNGGVVDNLQDNSDHCYARVANVVEHEGSLYLGSIGESAVGRYRLSTQSNTLK